MSTNPNDIEELNFIEANHYKTSMQTEVLNAYLSILNKNLLKQDELHAHFWSHGGLSLCSSLLSPAITPNENEYKIACDLKQLIGSNISVWVNQISNHPNPNLAVWIIARVLWFSEDFNKADQILSHFLPDCYEGGPIVAGYFIRALQKAEKYEILIKHFPITINKLVEVDSAVTFNIIELKWHGFETAPTHIKSIVGKNYLELGKDIQKGGLYDIRHKYLYDILDVAVLLDAELKRDVSQIKKEVFKQKIVSFFKGGI